MNKNTGLTMSVVVAWLAAVVLMASAVPSMAQVPEASIFDPGKLKPVDSELKVAVGEMAPDFTLPTSKGGTLSLSEYRGEKNVMLSFVPGAWTPVCSQQWPGYDLARKLFEENDTVVIGITVDSAASQHAWTQAMGGGVWFPVLSDFWPHGQVAERYGLLRTDGVSERALVFIDKSGIIRSIIVSDINVRPNLDTIAKELERLD